MIDIITFNGDDLVLSPELPLHKPFKELLERDDTVGKHRAKRDCTFIFLTKDPRSSLSVYPPATRATKACIMVYGKEIRIDRKIGAASDYYEQLIKESSAAYVIWEAAKSAMNRLTDIMRTTTWDADSAFTVKEFATYIKEAEGMASNLAALERKVKEEIIAAPKLKAQQTVNYFEQ